MKSQKGHSLENVTWSVNLKQSLQAKELCKSTLSGLISIGFARSYLLNNICPMEPDYYTPLVRSKLQN